MVKETEFTKQNEENYTTLKRTNTSTDTATEKRCTDTNPILNEDKTKVSVYAGCNKWNEMYQKMRENTASDLDWYDLRDRLDGGILPLQEESTTFLLSLKLKQARSNAVSHHWTFEIAGTKNPSWVSLSQNRPSM